MSGLGRSKKNWDCLVLNHMKPCSSIANKLNTSFHLRNLSRYFPSLAVPADPAQMPRHFREMQEYANAEFSFCPEHFWTSLLPIRMSKRFQIGTLFITSLQSFWQSTLRKIFTYLRTATLFATQAQTIGRNKHPSHKWRIFQTLSGSFC